MPASINFKETENGYSADNEGTSIGPFQNLATVQFVVANASVYCQVAKLNKQDQSLHWDPYEIPLAPASGGFEDKAYGVRFRSAVTDEPAVIAATVYFVDDAVPFLSPQPFDGTLDPGGGFVPPTPGSGIQFDIDPQVGDTLDVETTGDDGSGAGIKIVAGGTGFLHLGGLEEDIADQFTGANGDQAISVDTPKIDDLVGQATIGGGDTDVLKTYDGSHGGFVIIQTAGDGGADVMMQYSIDGGGTFIDIATADQKAFVPVVFGDVGPSLVIQGVNSGGGDEQSATIAVTGLDTHNSTWLPNSMVLATGDTTSGRIAIPTFKDSE